MIGSQTHVNWRRSRRCDSGTCVEVAYLDGAFAVRDSKTDNGPMLTFTRPDWEAFLAGVRAGDFEFEVR